MFGYKYDGCPTQPIIKERASPRPPLGGPSATSLDCTPPSFGNRGTSSTRFPPPSSAPMGMDMVDSKVMIKHASSFVSDEVAQTSLPSSDNLYGSQMLVSNRRRRPNSKPKVPFVLGP